MRANLIEYINKNKSIIYKEINKHLQKLDIPQRLKDSMIYSFEAGGKRLRPILLLASYQAYNSGIEKVLSAAVALEMVHTYSLIHDDLPAMDNDDIRRGKPTNHKAFDEATAILAGDALLTYSFEIISTDPHLLASQKVKLLKMLAQASGPSGMVAGQVLDMEAESKLVTLQELENIHTLKTGKLLAFAILTGAYLGNATSIQLEYLNEFAFYLGLIFQVQDDILDVMGDPNKMGKPVGSDSDNEKSTYPTLLGIEGAEEQKKQYVSKAKNALAKADAHQSNLMDLTEYFSRRDH